MTKIQLKSDNITPFGGLYPQFSKQDKVLGLFAELRIINDMKRLLICFISMFLTSIMSAQENTPPAVIDVEGLEPGMIISYSDFVKKFGKPDKYRSYDSDFGLSEDYEIHGCNFHCEENGVLHDFYITDSRYRVLTHYFKEGVRVGDDFSILYTLKPTFVQNLNDGTSLYVLFENISDDVLHIIVKQRKIISIFFDYSV